MEQIESLYYKYEAYALFNKKAIVIESYYPM